MWFTQYLQRQASGFFYRFIPALLTQSNFDLVWSQEWMLEEVNTKATKKHSNAEQPNVIFLKKNRKSDCCGAGWMWRSVFCKCAVKIPSAKVKGTWKWGTHDEAWCWGWACVIVDRHIKSVSPKMMCVWGRRAENTYIFTVAVMSQI